ncbi:MAG: hypothetical protein ABIE23_00565, partial [archaeon]
MKHALVLISLLFFSLNAFAETDFAYKGLPGFNNLTSFITLQLAGNWIIQIILVIAAIIAVLFFLFKKGIIRKIGEERVMGDTAFGKSSGAKAEAIEKSSGAKEEEIEEELPELSEESEEELPEEVPEEPAEKEPEIEKPFKEKAPID